MPFEIPACVGVKNDARLVAGVQLGIAVGHRRHQGVDLRIVLPRRDGAQGVVVAEQTDTAEAG